jgi:hypothetical protein
MMPRTKKLPPKEPLLIRSLTHTPTTEAIVKQLSQDASDSIGRPISSSAIIRALLRYADQQDTQWEQEQLFPFVEKELSSGILWGAKKK